MPSMPHAGLDAFPVLDCLTSLRLLGTAVDDRGCRNLAAALPQLLELTLGSKAVGDKGLRALCSLPKASAVVPGVEMKRWHSQFCCMSAGILSATATMCTVSLTLLQLEALHLVDCSVTDPGLLRALPRCPTLFTLSLQGCWLASDAGLQAAAAAALQAGGRLQQVLRDRAPVELPPSSKAASASASTAGARRASQGGGVAEPPASQRRTSGAGRLTAQVLACDERYAYSRAELLQLGAASQLGAKAAAAAAQLRPRLPADLRSPGCSAPAQQ